MKRQKFLKPCMDNCGYYHWRLARNAHYTLVKVHRLVAKHFLPDYTEELTVNHINRNQIRQQSIEPLDGNKKIEHLAEVLKEMQKVDVLANILVVLFIQKMVY